jgi:hypothetical protein
MPFSILKFLEHVKWFHICVINIFTKINNEVYETMIYSILPECGVLIMRHNLHVSKDQVFKDFVFHQNEHT